MAKFKVGDKVRLIKGGGRFPLRGFENEKVYMVTSELKEQSHGYETYQILGFCSDFGYAKPEQLELVTPKYTKKQRIEALESQVEKQAEQIAELQSTIEKLREALA